MQADPGYWCAGNEKSPNAIHWTRSDLRRRRHELGHAINIALSLGSQLLKPVIWYWHQPLVGIEPYIHEISLPYCTCFQFASFVSSFSHRLPQSTILRYPSASILKPHRYELWLAALTCMSQAKACFHWNAEVPEVGSTLKYELLYELRCRWCNHHINAVPPL